MPRATGLSVENNFKAGLVTEATGLNFPENACTDMDNVTLNLPGDVVRRKGFDFEANFSTKTIDRTNKVVQTFRWNDVGGDGTVILLVNQIGSTLYFYDGSSTDPVSGHAISATIDLTAFSPAGAPSPATEECEFTEGNGLLFVVHPFLDAFSVAYDATTQTFTTSLISLTIRDFEGVVDNLDISERPLTGFSGMTDAHHYNLLNQGWSDDNLHNWDSNRSDMPSNCDVMWTFKNTSNNFDTNEVNKLFRGNSPAPKGHFILSLFDQNRSSAAGGALTVTGLNTGSARCSCIAFYAGRLFYSGLNYTGLNSQIFFSQIIERTAQYGQCYQSNDPTSEDTFDLLASDGGVVKLQEAGNIIKMIPTSFGLLIFASNGVWMLSGSTGIGFTATDFTVQKISNVRTLTRNSFVEVNGSIAWWALEGIYTIGGSASAPNVVSLTDTRIKQFYNTIPPSSKRKANGFYNPITGIIQWLYRDTDAGDVTTLYECNHVLCYSTVTTAFYKWSLPTSPVKLHAAVILENLGGEVLPVNVVDNLGNQVVDNLGNDVIYYSITDGIVIPKFKYLVSYPNSGSYKFTWAEEWSTTYLDWVSYDSVGVDYESFFTTGYKVHGQGSKKFQSNFVNVFSKAVEATKYYFQGLWDYANTGSTGRWTSKEFVSNTSISYDYVRRRLKLRGSGVVLQFKISSITGQPFDIAGWSVYETANQIP